ncbi:MAG: hypothetical protein KDB62_10415, partial [Solirubrobacterales bacterium]|nr:hypothetical protein [Solirubrobacterales bacterium]
IWASRHGLEEPELLDLLGDGDTRLPGAYWSPLRIAASALLIERAGRVDFAHDFIRTAVEHRYLPTETDRLAVRERLAGYFRGLGPTPRALDEAPWQLAQAGRWDELVALLVDPGWFVALYRLDEFEVRRYWVAIEAGSDRRAAIAYTPPLASDPGEVDAHYLNGVAVLLGGLGSPGAALPFLERLHTWAVDHGDQWWLQVSLGNQAVIHGVRGELDRAMELHRECEQICRTLGDPAVLQASLCGQGLIHWDRGELDRALELLRDQERISRGLGDLSGLSISLGNQASIHWDRGELDRALELSGAQERICRELGDPAGLAQSLAHQVLVLRDRGDDGRAAGTMAEALDYARRSGHAALIEWIESLAG